MSRASRADRSFPVVPNVMLVGASSSSARSSFATRHSLRHATISRHTFPHNGARQRKLQPTCRRRRQRRRLRPSRRRLQDPPRLLHLQPSSRTAAKSTTLQLPLHVLAVQLLRPQACLLRHPQRVMLSATVRFFSIRPLLTCNHRNRNLNRGYEEAWQTCTRRRRDCRTTQEARQAC